MGLDGTHGRQAAQAQRTSAVPPQRHLPFDLAAWAAEPRPETPPGIFRLGYRPQDGTRTEQATVPPGPLLTRAALNLVVGWLVFIYGRALCLNLIAYAVDKFEIGSRIDLGQGRFQYVVPTGQRDLVALAVNVLMILLVVRYFGRMGRWAEVFRRYAAPLLARTVTQEASEGGADASGRTHPADPWFEVRAGAPGAVRRLEGEQLGDVDYARIRHAWDTVLADPDLLPAFAEQVEARGAAACAHPSEARDLPGRTGRHDLLTRQVRLGTAQNVVKNPLAHRSAGFALDPQLLGTSLLAVGPAGTGKTARLGRPVAEALCLQALAGTACAVVIGAADADLGPDAWYDVVIAPGDPRSPYGLDLYGAAADPDEAAARLADALLPDELAQRAETARTALQQVVGPYHAAHGRYPGVRELRALLGGDPDAWAVLRKALQAAGVLAVHEAELQHRERQHGRADDPGALLADRLALLDRPVFAGCFPGGPAGGLPPFAMRALDHPLRVRVKLPERSHPEVARVLSRLVVAQFVQAASARTERSLFAGLVVDDASAAVDVHTVRGLQRMRGANAGAVLLLRTLADMPEPLRAPLFGAVGCRMAFPGIAPWDGRLFSEAWGTHLVTETAVTHTPDTSGGLVRKAARGVRKALSGTTAQTESVTTRDVERHRWSPSDLAHALPSGHAVVSLTTVDGEQVPPLLVDLRG
ncbi:ATP-binding protein [Kitasatospora sp. KL5]|uniref:ATP-binding protein n=1 Tax=Kitasatospora sp. KL5 TaxID=3425125 RepID=UPI003D6F5B0A